MSIEISDQQRGYRFFDENRLSEVENFQSAEHVVLLVLLVNILPSP